MIDPTSGSVGWPSFNRGIGPNRPPQGPSGPTPSGPVFPRSGWADATHLSSFAQQALNRLNNDYSGIFNWRRPSEQLFPRPGLPEMAAMYGLAFPPRDNGPSPGSPVRPPEYAAMYGLAYPPRDTVPGPQPPVRPPEYAAMYGLAYPPRDSSPGFDPPVRPPEMSAMYGLAFPPGGGGGGGGSVRPPENSAMYGLAYPNS